MKIVLRPHLKLRLKERFIPEDYPKRIIRQFELKFNDAITDHKIAIKSLEYNGKVRPMVVSYDIIGSELQVVTIHPTNEKEIKNRLKSGRWVEDEKTD